MTGGTRGAAAKAEGLPSTALGMGTTTIILGTGSKGCPAGDRTAGGRTHRMAEGRVVTCGTSGAEGVTVVVAVAPGRVEVIGRRA